MIRIIYNLLPFFIRYSGLGGLFRFLFARNRVSVVLYHNPRPEVFERHLEFFSRKYNLISMNELSTAIRSENFDFIPKYALVVTLDDGWKENFELLPIIKKYQFRPTIFLTSHLIDTERHFWWTACSFKAIDFLKSLPNHQRIKELKEKFFYEPDKEYTGERQALSLLEIEEMKLDVDFGLHTCYHPVLPKCSYEEKRKEIVECKNKVEKMLGSKIEFFSYPNGDYDEECIEILKDCGVRIARTTDSGWNHKHSDPYKLKVTGVSDNSSVNKLIAELTGIPMYLQYLAMGRLNGIKSINW